MASRKKLIERLKGAPKDFQWQEMSRLLAQLGYTEREGDGSRVKFRRAGFPKINLHKPHPGNIMKEYAVKQVRDILEEAGLI